MVCTNCIAQYYRGRLAPIVMLPKEFAGTIIKVTKRGIKIIPAFPDYLFKSRSRQNLQGERRGRGRRLPLPSLPASPAHSRPLSSPVSNDFLVGEKPLATTPANFSPSKARQGLKITEE